MNMARFAAIAATVMIPTLICGVPEANAKQLGPPTPIKTIYSECKSGESRTCYRALHTCTYYRDSNPVGDPSDPTGCCGWYDSHCIAAPNSPGGGGGGAGGPNGGVAPRPPNSGNGGRKVQ